MGRYQRDIPGGKHIREDPTIVENLKYDIEDLEEKLADALNFSAYQKHELSSMMTVNKTCVNQINQLEASAHENTVREE